jgi:hypothetical protein
MSKMHLSGLTCPNAELVGITNINVVLGRNGSGKSRFLRAMRDGLTDDPTYVVQYVNPERAGSFRFDGGMQTQMRRDSRYLQGERVGNQAPNFKQGSANLLEAIELSYLRKLENTPALRTDLNRTFQTDRLSRINALLANISVDRVGSDFGFLDNAGTPIEPHDISSGESEAVSLASEIMYFFETLDYSKFNLLLLDEPDVHLHPDLQGRLARYIVKSFDEVPAASLGRVAVCVATHSSPLVCALASSPFTSIGTKDFANGRVEQRLETDQLRKIAPFFGHPLSLTLNDDALLILEGEDDERVWQQAARSSQGRIRLFPVLASSVDQQSELEKFCASMLSCLYDSPIAYSLRDGDGKSGKLDDIESVLRFRLNCYAIENLLVTDECLTMMKTTWVAFQTAVNKWCQGNSTHEGVALLSDLVTSPNRLQNVKIKEIRHLICAIAGVKKPWEVIVGQTLGTLDLVTATTGPMGLVEFVGKSALKSLLERTS